MLKQSMCSSKGVVALILFVNILLFGCGDGSLAPNADAGADQTVDLLELVTLDGSNSFDGDGDSLDYLWSFMSVPQNSVTTIASPSSQVTSFVADVEGIYNVLLVVDDGYWDDSDTVKITCYNSPL